MGFRFPTYLCFACLCIFFGVAHAEKKYKIGTYSLATQAGWGSAFELSQNGKALITPNYDHEASKNKKKKVEKPKPIEGTWKTTRDGIEISYLAFNDQFRFERQYQGWKQYPCFRYLKTSLDTADKSPLDFGYPYINWDWKN